MNSKHQIRNISSLLGRELERGGEQSTINSDCGTESAMTAISKNDKNTIKQNQPSCLAASSPAASSDTNHSPLTTHHSLKQKLAFTLAEVLITLGIIGIVAALSFPTIIANSKKSEISARLKKFNTIMSQCVLLSEQDNGPAEEWSSPRGYDTFDLDSFFKTYVAPYIKYSSTELKTENGSKRYYVYLLDGGYFYFAKGNCVDIIYDVNGKKKPNAHGRDIFRFLLCGDKSPEWCDGRHYCPMNRTSDKTREQKIQACIKGDRGSGCTGLLEYDGWEFKKDYPFRL